jgi:hypothetical protein
MMRQKPIEINNSGNGAIDMRGAAFGDGSTAGYHVVNTMNSDPNQTTDQLLSNLYLIQKRLEQSTDLPDFESESLREYLDKAIKAQEQTKPDKERVQKSLKHMKVITDGIATVSSAIAIGELIASAIALFG